MVFQVQVLNSTDKKQREGVYINIRIARENCFSQTATLFDIIVHIY